MVGRELLVGSLFLLYWCQTMCAQATKMSLFQAPSRGVMLRYPHHLTIRKRISSCQHFRFMATPGDDNSKPSAAAPATSTTLAPGIHQAEMEVKKSRFIGYAQHAETWKEAQEFLSVVKQEHPKSRHIAFGFVAGCNPVQERCSDDGEPTGTAGLPVLGGIKGEDLSDVVCAVVRYFGGVKLGAGGLIRAYGGAARLILREAPKETLIPKTSMRTMVPSQSAGVVYDAIAKAGGVASEEEYTAEGDFIVTLTCDLEKEDSLRDSLTDSTRGAVKFLVQDKVDDAD